MKEILEEDGTIYEIIVAARDRLSEMNSSPDGECAICLCCFDSYVITSNGFSFCFSVRDKKFKVIQIDVTSKPITSIKPNCKKIIRFSGVSYLETTNSKLLHYPIIKM